MTSIHIPASLDQQIITGLLKSLKLGPGTQTVCCCKIAKVSRESLGFGLSHLTLASFHEVRASMFPQKRAGLLSWRAWISHLPPCLWLLSYFIQPKRLPEVQVKQALWRLEFFPMEYSNLFFISTNIYWAFTLYLVPYQELVVFHSMSIYWVLTKYWELCSVFSPAVKEVSV